MTLEEQNIEKNIVPFFFNGSKKTEKEKADFYKLLFSSVFTQKILMKSFSGYTDVIDSDELSDFKQSIMNIVFNQVCRLYTFEKGVFINYFSFVLKRTAIEELQKRKEEIEKEVSFDTPIGDDSDSTLEDSNILEDKSVNIEEEYEKNEQIKKIRKKLLKAINGFYKSTKAGQTNKSKIYTYYVLEMLISLSEEELDETIKKYDFLTLNEIVIKQVLQDSKKNKNLPTQKEFGEIIGVAENRFSSMISQLMEELKISYNLQDFFNL